MAEKQKVIMGARDIERALNRIALQILEKNHEVDELVIVGIHTGGVFLADRLHSIVKEREQIDLPAGSLDKLFSPGWTTKSEDEGTGLGLFISRRIVERHDGTIEAGNDESGGAVFVVNLPAALEGTPKAGA